MIDYTEWDGFGIWFSTDFTSSIDFFGRVCFFFFDRMMRMMMIRIMRMIRIEREMRMIVRVDRALTVKDSWVWMNPSWLEAWIVIDVAVSYTHLKVKQEFKIEFKTDIHQTMMFYQSFQ